LAPFEPASASSNASLRISTLSQYPIQLTVCSRTNREGLSMPKSITSFLCAAIFLGTAVQASAQSSNTGTAAPEGMPPEVTTMLQNMRGAGAETSIAPSEAPGDLRRDQRTGTGTGVTAGSRYLYTTLRVVSSGSARGCGYADWNCMTNLCRSDLADTSAWRGWAGCWRRDSWICYFECGQRAEAF
jgi:hypothetical protein